MTSVNVFKYNLIAMKKISTLYLRISKKLYMGTHHAFQSIHDFLLQSLRMLASTKSLIFSTTQVMFFRVCRLRQSSDADLSSCARHFPSFLAFEL